MAKQNTIVIFFLLFTALSFAEIREPQKIERIACEVTRISDFDFSFVDQTAEVPQKKSWIKRHPVIAGTLIGFGAGALLGQASNGDYSAWGKIIWFGGIGAGAGALVGKVASEY